MKFTLPTVSSLQQLTVGCSDGVDEQHADTFFTVFKLITRFADEVQQLVFAGDCVKLVLQQLESTEALESPHLVAQLLDVGFL